MAGITAGVPAVNVMSRNSGVLARVLDVNVTWYCT